ncbi:hypothetical protein B6D25_05735 [Micrococcus luteus]|jgi:hypothetical protein|uniref:hypothetical protein n=1 Tax=Micrococcus luteus TaxID=1270 RepID=UPI0001C396FD|nr:hypothetical protein [Micrococcus luteus]KAB1902839.1 hypothetical protein F8198_03440 [Micrococcus luteus NCTC 2665]ORE61768.1 hypothetical protein B6D25_05735 [Micrococcus luteus]QCY44207.1 hypothetical protein ERB44_02925 [Micrococcus luteus]RFP73377.1 hypothetical protein D0N42_02950 [Micrococcus luteus]HAN85682.1 hypothetical protein [Micrococcus luteus]
MTANHSHHTAAAADSQGAAAEHAGTATTDPRRDTRSRWGRSSRLGGGSGRLILVSLVAGVVIALLIGAAAYGLASSQGDADPRFPTVMGAVMAASALPAGAALAWLFLVDRTTLRGAVRDTEETIEGRWLERAQSGAFGDLLVVLGLGTFVVALAGWQLSLPLVGAGLLLFAGASVAIRYALQKRRG